MKGTVHLPSFFSVLDGDLVTLGGNGFPDGVTAAVDTECGHIGGEGDWILILGDLKLLYHCLSGWFSGRDGSPGGLDVPWCKSMRSCSPTWLQHDVPCVVVTEKQQNVALSPGVVEDRAEGSLAVELSSWTVMNGIGFFSGDFVGQLDVDAQFHLATVVDSCLSSMAPASTEAAPFSGCIQVLC